MRAKILLFALLLSHAALLHAGAVRNLPGFSVNVFGPNDDGSFDCTGLDVGQPVGCSPQLVSIGFPITFYGQTFSNLYVNNNGNVTLRFPLSDYTPDNLTNSESEIIAPFFADVDTRLGNVVTFGNDTVDGRAAFGVNWLGVGYFEARTNKLDSFQLVLIDRADRNRGDFDIEFNYDQIQWESGDDSEGNNGLGGETATAGYSNGSSQPGTSFQLDGSSVPGAFLDVNPGGLIHNQLNSTVPGRYVLPIINLPTTALNVTRFAQGDSRWAAQAYANSASTIQEKGCALACLAMALNYAGVATDPGALNAFLTNHDDFAGAGLNWDPATRDASDGALQFHAFRANDEQYLTDLLSQGYPVIVGVNLNSRGEPQHFVLVTGQENGAFFIADPGHANALTLDFYTNIFETRGYVAPSTGDLSGFDFAAPDVGELLVVNGVGQRAGRDPSSSAIIQQIPQSVYFDDCIEEDDLTGAPGTQPSHTLILSQPLASEYQAYLFGSNSGPYQINLRAFASNGAPQSEILLTGVKYRFAFAANQAELSPNGLSAQTFTNESPWSVSPTNGLLPLTALFSGPPVDARGIAITNYYWTFGDGFASSLQNPTNFYLAPGVYYPVLETINANGLAEVSVGPFVVLPAAPFAAQPVFGYSPLTVNFTATNVDDLGYPISDWAWRFGDGATNSGQNTSHVYNASQIYSPGFTATDSAGYLVTGIGPEIVVAPSSVPFTAAPLSGVPPLSVQFVASNADTAGHAITNWTWNFGDGSTGSGQNPSHIYTVDGQFAPTLYATNSLGLPVNGNGPDITVYNPTAQFTASPLDGFVPLTVQFNAPDADNLGNSISNWFWTFGDGATATGRTPSHTYTRAGTFTPAFTATNSLGQLVLGSGPNVIAVSQGANPVVNSGFETGDFTGWTLSGPDTGDLFVDDGSASYINPHTGTYLAVLGSVGALSSLSQTVPTTARATYLLSLWLNSPDGLTPNEFAVSWNGRKIYDHANLPYIVNWTNLQFLVTALGTSSTITIGGRDDSSYLGLDDVSLLPAQPLITGVSLSVSNLTLTGSSALPTTAFQVLTSTNLGLPLTQWQSIAANTLQSNGAFTITLTNAVNASASQRFYILQVQ